MHPETDRNTPAERNTLELSSETMTELFPHQHTVYLPAVRSSREVVEAMVSRLVQQGHVAEAAFSKVVEAVMQREQYGSSAIGSRLAFPHVRTALASQLSGCFAFLESGCDFAALDGRPTQCVWLTLAPISERQRHVAVLDRLFRLVRDPTIQLWMEHPRAAERIWQYFTGAH